jgi:DNA-binding NarL/FixJ family response regulator
VPRVLIVEDHGLLAQSLMFALRADGLEVERCEQLTAAAVLGAVESYQPHLVLLDLDLGDEGPSVPLIAPIRERGSEVVMVTGVTERPRLAECVEAGAMGVIGKSEPFERLVEAVHEAVELGTIMSPGQRDELLAELRRQRAEVADRTKWFSDLTPREQQVLAALMDGKSAEAIAAEWVVSISTIRSQIRAILQKLGVSSQLAAVAAARHAGWQPPVD